MPNDDVPLPDAWPARRAPTAPLDAEVADDAELPWPDPPPRPARPPLDDVPDADPEPDTFAAARNPSPAPGPIALEPAVVPWRCEGRVDGQPTAIRCDPNAATSRLYGADGARVVQVEVAGLRFDVAVAGLAGAAELVLGRDALRGRLWIAVEEQ